MTDNTEALPPLPEPYRHTERHISAPITRNVLFAPGDYFTADQMRDYARAALAQRQQVPTELQRLRDALLKIADWHGAWGPYPENNEAWRAMAIMTAREAVPALTAAPSAQRQHVTGWINVKDQMPPPDSNLLVVWGDHQAVDKAHTFTKWKHPTHPLGYLIQGHPGSHNDVTKWMFLPDASEAPSAQAEPQMVAPQDGMQFWLWKNGDHFLAFTHLYPCFTPGGDPMVLGEPVGRAVFRRSFHRSGRGNAIGPAQPELPKARSLTDELMDCVDRLGSEAKDVDPRVWDHLRVYMPAPQAAQAEPQEPLTPKRDCRNCALQFVDSHRCDTCHKQNGYQNWVARGIGKQDGT